MLTLSKLRDALLVWFGEEGDACIAVSALWLACLH